MVKAKVKMSCCRVRGFACHKQVPSSSQRLDFAAATAAAYYPLKSDAGLRPKNKDLHSFIHTVVALAVSRLLQ